MHSVRAPSTFSTNDWTSIFPRSLTSLLYLFDVWVSWPLFSSNICWEDISGFWSLTRWERFPESTLKTEPQNVKIADTAPFYVTALKVSLGHEFPHLWSTPWLLHGTWQPLPFICVLRTALTHIQRCLRRMDYVIPILNFTSALSNIY